MADDEPNDPRIGEVETARIEYLNLQALRNSPDGSSFRVLLLLRTSTDRQVQLALTGADLQKLMQKIEEATTMLEAGARHRSN